MQQLETARSKLKRIIDSSIFEFSNRLTLNFNPQIYDINMAAVYNSKSSDTLSWLLNCPKHTLIDVEDGDDKNLWHVGEIINIDKEKQIIQTKFNGWNYDIVNVSFDKIDAIIAPYRTHTIGDTSQQAHEKLLQLLNSHTKPIRKRKQKSQSTTTSTITSDYQSNVSGNNPTENRKRTRSNSRHIDNQDQNSTADKNQRKHIKVEDDDNNDNDDANITNNLSSSSSKSLKSVSTVFSSLPLWHSSDSGSSSASHIIHCRLRCFFFQTQM